MDYLAINDFDLCFKLLKNAEKILLHSNTAEAMQVLGQAMLEMNPEHKRTLLSLTFNNLGCYYKK